MARRSQLGDDTCLEWQGNVWGWDRRDSVVLPDGLLEGVLKSESPNLMIVALASLSPPCALLQVAIQSVELAGIAEGELSRYRYVLGCRRSAGRVSVLVGVSRAGRFSARTYLQRNHHH